MSRTVHYRCGEDERTVQVEREGEQFRVSVGERTFVISARAGENGRLDLCVDGNRRRAYAVRQRERTYLWLDGEVWTLTAPDPRRRTTQRDEGGGSLEAAMPGRVLDVLVHEGDTVKRGDTLVLLEAMKMELRVQAPADGEVVQVFVTPGAVVERGQLLVKVT
jgi:biotin carboxyl carrier protein